jgi:dihydrofolate reductase
MMASYWPTPIALEQNPGVAVGINASEKIVFSNTLKKAEWSNTKVIGGDIVEEIKKLKRTTGNDMTILGSGSIISQFSDHGLIDTYLFMVDPIALPDGTPVFHGMNKKLDLKLADVRKFKSGVVLLTYTP